MAASTMLPILYLLVALASRLCFCAAVDQAQNSLLELGDALASRRPGRAAPVLPPTSWRLSRGLIRGARHPAVHVVLCYGDSQDSHADFLIERLRSHGYGVVLPDCTADFSEVFASNVTGNHYNYWGRRLAHYREAVGALPEDAVAMLLDVRDVLVIGSAEEVVGRFHALGKQLLASCTEAMWPPPEDCPSYLSAPLPMAGTSQCRFPCAGALMGTRSALVELFNASFTEATNDQCWLHGRLAQPGEAWALDINGSIFLDVNRVPKRGLQPLNGRFRVNNVTDLETLPSVIHLQGLHPTSSAVRELLLIADRSANRSANGSGQVKQAEAEAGER
mmetsp:Transcript_66747/g.145595  ORF Transcript_66747/g.145595 Transcript_66747/m.145595 type:complete len:334 (+) Transcript_66747:87-1088(+)|eukprot:CAMPEP_0170627592 /NCGR_PEP_ID=MMETSP0224-20130122/32063_1 /TAXON_ID=285029 /ORGANISM="Togula jolla, Strain CCCM 725" /LENGTH=333 /DNA_ID=CAMNT_0010954621 /DNA_START=54 /DNA_END=1055 /DNA_ORIENTATION=-